MNYPEALRYLLSLLGDIRGANFGLHRMQKLMARLGQPHRAFRVVHVAGTNGKGSTAAMIDGGLRAAGFSTGLYTSPHLVRFNERYRINSSDVDDDAFVAAVEEVRAANEKLAAIAGGEQHPTFFETLTAIAFCAFRNAAVDWGVIEVGLGGRLDATNVVSAEIAVITPVALDHEAFLGSSPRSIAEEKAGILKPGSKAITSPQHPEAAAVIAGRAHELGIPLVQVGVDWKAANISHAEGCYRFEAVPAAAEKSGFPVELSLAGRHQIENALCAIAALGAAGADSEAIRRGLRQTRWAARLEQLSGKPPILLDAAHNPSGAATLARFLEEHHAGRRIHLIYGAVRDKAVDDVASLLFPLAYRVILTRSNVPRSLQPETLREIVDHHHEHIETAATVEEAIRMARRVTQDNDLIVIAGSIFLVGEAREALQAVSSKS
jgi:dihydrofolate synthase / folylpolyglutamate synthase